MAKTLWILCIGASLTFLLTQFIMLMFSENKFDAPRSKHLLYNVEIFQNICNLFNISCVLIDGNILQYFLDNEIRHRSNGVHNHKQCALFCDRKVVQFLMHGGELQNHFQALQAAFLKFSFRVQAIEGPDKRVESLEVRQSKEKLVYHVYLKRNNTIIHLLISYPRLNCLWINKSDGLYAVKNKLLTFSGECLLERFTTAEAMLDGLYVTVPKYMKAFLDEMNTSTFMPCNYNQAREFYSKYGYENDETSANFRLAANQVLQQAADALDLLKIPFWLSSGTCLGWFRQCDFIPHSKDVDIGIWIKDYDLNLINSLTKKGFTLKYRFGKVSDSFELSFQFDELKLDIFFFYEDNNTMWNGGTQLKTGKKFKYIFPKFRLCWTIFSQIVVRVPCQTLSYITANYGSEWNSLVKKWDWKNSPSNVVPNGEWNKEEYNEVMQWFQ